MTTRSAHRGSILHCTGDPGDEIESGNVEFLPDGLLVVADGRVERVGPAETLLEALPANTPVEVHDESLIVPGLIDCHVHFPQLEIVASWGAQLLDWLERYAYPAERRYAAAGYAAQAAEFFCDELLANGTTTALVFATVHAASADALFDAAARRNMRLLTGKVLMDRGCPDDLRDDPDTASAETAALIDKWHGRQRLGYAVTPRFALTSSERQLQAAGRLLQDHPGVYLHTHLAENEAEVAAVAKQFRWSRSYLDVYEQFGLVSERSVFAHCVHLDDEDRRQMADRRAAIAFCPSSNLFLGSGLFDLEAAEACDIRVGAGSDVGGGTSLSMLSTLADGYKVAQLRGQALTPFKAFYLATLGAARALSLDEHIGNFEPGKEADFIVLDPRRTTLTMRRLEGVDDVAEKLFALIVLGDERNVAATYLMGEKVG